MYNGNSEESSLGVVTLQILTEIIKGSVSNSQFISLAACEARSSEACECSESFWEVDPSYLMLNKRRYYSTAALAALLVHGVSNVPTLPQSRFKM